MAVARPHVPEYCLVHAAGGASRSATWGGRRTMKIKLIPRHELFGIAFATVVLISGFALLISAH